MWSGGGGQFSIEWEKFHSSFFALVTLYTVNLLPQSGYTVNITSDYLYVRVCVLTGGALYTCVGWRTVIYLISKVSNSFFAN